MDSEAEFAFVAWDTDAATITDGIPFDMAGVEHGHVDGRCSFESILVKCRLQDPALRLLGRIVHGVDIPADLGSSRRKHTDCERSPTGSPSCTGRTTTRRAASKSSMYDALYAWCREQVTRRERDH